MTWQTQPFPLSSNHGQRVARFEADASENKAVVAIPIRLEWSLHARQTEERVSAWETRTRRRQ